MAIAVYHGLSQKKLMASLWQSGVQYGAVIARSAFAPGTRYFHQVLWQNHLQNLQCLGCHSPFSVQIYSLSASNQAAVPSRNADRSGASRRPRPPIRAAEPLGGDRIGSRRPGLLGRFWGGSFWTVFGGPKVERIWKNCCFLMDKLQHKIPLVGMGKAGNDAIYGFWNWSFGAVVICRVCLLREPLLSDMAQPSTLLSCDIGKIMKDPNVQSRSKSGWWHFIEISSFPLQWTKKKKKKKLPPSQGTSWTLFTLLTARPARAASRGGPRRPATPKRGRGDASSSRLKGVKATEPFGDAPGVLCRQR